jgi:hypothetical protein
LNGVMATERPVAGHRLLGAGDRKLTGAFAPCFERPERRTLSAGEAGRAHGERAMSTMLRDGDLPMTRALFIVSVYRPDLYTAALQAVGTAQDVEVVLDRRVGERRRPGRRQDPESTANDRRLMAIDEQLRRDGWALVAREARDDVRRRLDQPR